MAAEAEARASAPGFTWAAPGPAFDLMRHREGGTMASPEAIAAAAALADRLLRWWCEGGHDLARFIGVPDTPYEWRLVRDYELCEAAYYVQPAEDPRRGGWPASDDDRRAAGLLEAAEDFERTAFRRWREHGVPPGARLIDRHIFNAMNCRCGVKFPRTRQGLKRIISDQDDSSE